MKRLTLAIVASAFIFTGCAGGPSMQADEALNTSRQALNKAYSKKLDRECPDEFRAAEKKFKDAVALYKKCNCEKAIAMAEDARKELEALCPVTETPSPAPRPASPSDSDNDGVIDANDRCPGTPAGATVNRVGCWIIKGLLFDFGKADIKPAYHHFLDNVIRVLKKNPEMLIEIQGHTDSVGSEAFNMRLSTKRAKAVADYLIAHGIDKKRLTVTGFGETRPVASNDTEEGRAQNRRVQLKVRN